MLAIFVAMVLGWPAPLIVAQILWIHLICDGPSDIVLGFEPGDKGTMDEPPLSPREPILDRLGFSLIGIISICSAAAALALFNHLFSAHGNAVEGRSIVFASFAINSMVYIFAYRSMRQPLFRMNPHRPDPHSGGTGGLAPGAPVRSPPLGRHWGSCAHGSEWLWLGASPCLWRLSNWASDQQQGGGHEINERMRAGKQII